MRLDRSLTLGLFYSLRHLRWTSRRRRLPILMYHSISGNAELDVRPYYRVCTSPTRFAEQMGWLAAAGWRGVTLREGLEALAAESSFSHKPCSAKTEPDLKRQPEKLIAITFDDGFRDFYDFGLPVLQRHGFYATMYVPTAFIGEERRRFKSHDCMTWGELRELNALGVEIGSHTVNHPRLAELLWPEVKTELSDSKTVLELQLGCPVNSFAYPFAFPQENKVFAEGFHDLLRTVGYSSCVTTAIGRAQASDDPLRLPRLPANSADDQTLFLAKLSGAYDWLSIPQKSGKILRRLLDVSPRKSKPIP